MASKKTYAELAAYFETGDKPTQSQFEDMLYTFFKGASALPKTYKVLISQVDTDAPTVVATHIDDTGLTFTFSRLGVGRYKLTPSVLPSDTKCYWHIQAVDTGFFSAKMDTGTLLINTYDDAGSYSDDLLLKTPLLFEIYP
jgi:hypothetical protein